MNLEINLIPVTKKNSQQVVMSGRYPKIIQSKAYRDYEKRAVRILEPYADRIPIDYPVNVKMIFYMPTRRRVDLVNLQEACLDVMTKAGIISDDNCNIVATMDGSAVRHDKDHPRTEIEITEIGSRAEIGAEMAEEVEG